MKFKNKFKVGDWVKKVKYHDKQEEFYAKKYPEEYYQIGECFQIEEVRQSPTVYFGSKGNGCFTKQLAPAPKLFNALK